ncbi:uncharacterized protein B0H18DRAFT_170081 [Fomitopsis serialis]|uniref:uncharacterized protein n=1 Tax=Fomitopsis serialis TaxID=139415 RepID=UPI002008B60B|nr:uncharacterized protein B0H18DRAFT_170081 [Neoantrodia serialis]KAH9913439.1 hypothetical protein B0H18DRAFT_170081 [Neoantrodia serialis]
MRFGAHLGQPIRTSAGRARVRLGSISTSASWKEDEGVKRSPDPRVREWAQFAPWPLLAHMHHGAAGRIDRAPACDDWAESWEGRAGTLLYWKASGAVIGSYVQPRCSAHGAACVPRAWTREYEGDGEKSARMIPALRETFPRVRALERGRIWRIVVEWVLLAGAVPTLFCRELEWGRPFEDTRLEERGLLVHEWLQYPALGPDDSCESVHPDLAFLPRRSALSCMSRYGKRVSFPGSLQTFPSTPAFPPSRTGQPPTRASPCAS